MSYVLIVIGAAVLAYLLAIGMTHLNDKDDDNR